MTIKKSILYVVALTLGFTACDNQEPWGKPATEEELLKNGKGELQLNVAANSPEKTRAAVSTENFLVYVNGLDEAIKGISKTYTVGNNLPESIELPVGNYQVKAASLPYACPKQHLYPYYGGSKNVEITKTATTQTTVNCKMLNSRISVNYSPEFLEQFASWEITINDGGNKALTYKQAETKPRDVYWLFEENTKVVTVDIRATTKAGVNVEAQATYNKHNSTEQYPDIDSEYFGGGDALEINFQPATNPNGYITGITITTKIEFTNENQDVVIEVVDNGNNTGGDPTPDPGQTPGDGIVVTFANGQEFTVDYGQSSGLPNVQVDFTFPTGVEHIYVKVAGSPEFTFACSLMGLTEGDGLDLAGEEALALADLFNLPKVGDKTYRFSLNDTLWDLLTCNPGYPGTQTFTLKAVDKNGAEKEGQLIININE